MTEIKKELRVTLKTKEQFREIAKILREYVGTSDNWRLRKILPDGSKNTGKRCRIIKHLQSGNPVDIAIEIYKNEDQVSEADLLYATLRH